MPPALVDRLPPIWQLPSAPRLNGNSRLASAAACCRSARMQPASRGDAATDEAGVAALRHDRQLRLGADPHHRGHLRGRSRADDQPGRAAVEAARLDEIGLLVARVGDPAARTDRCLDPLDGLRDLHTPSFRYSESYP